MLDIEERSPIIDDIGPTLPTYKYMYIIYMSIASILRSCDCATRHLDIFLSQCFDGGRFSQVETGVRCATSSKQIKK